MKIIVSKLQDGRKLKGALDILDKLRHPTSANKAELCSALEKQNKHKSYAKDVEKYMKKYCAG